MRTIVHGGSALLLVFLLGAWSSAPAAQGQEASLDCFNCHAEAKRFADNPHARGQITGTVTSHVCESCHGDGDAHVNAQLEGGGDMAIAVPRGGPGSDLVCMGCHVKDDVGRSHRAGAHANSAAVNCLSCHRIHEPASAEKLLVKEQPELCATCHRARAASFRNFPFTHKLGRAGLTCTSCHDPHARPGRENIRRTAAGDTACEGCHTEKRGPFVFQHGGAVVHECTTCHQPHGSSHPNQLKRARIAQLCLECHSPLTRTTIGSRPPLFHDLNDPRYQNCTTCHVAIHGSNRSPELLK